MGSVGFWVGVGVVGSWEVVRWGVGRSRVGEAGAGWKDVEGAE